MCFCAMEMVLSHRSESWPPRTSRAYPGHEPKCTKARNSPRVGAGSPRLDQREQDRLADAAAGQQHDQPVDTEAHAARRRHAVLEGEQELLVQLHGLGIALRRSDRLRGE